MSLKDRIISGLLAGLFGAPGDLASRMYFYNCSIDKPWTMLLPLPPFSFVSGFMYFTGKIEKGPYGCTKSLDDFLFIIPIATIIISYTIDFLFSHETLHNFHNRINYNKIKNNSNKHNNRYRNNHKYANTHSNILESQYKDNYHNRKKYGYKYEHDNDDNDNDDNDDKYDNDDEYDNDDKYDKYDDDYDNDNDNDDDDNYNNVYDNYRENKNEYDELKNSKDDFYGGKRMKKRINKRKTEKKWIPYILTLIALFVLFAIIRTYKIHSLCSNESDYTKSIIKGCIISCITIASFALVKYLSENEILQNLPIVGIILELWTSLDKIKGLQAGIYLSFVHLILNLAENNPNYIISFCGK